MMKKSRITSVIAMILSLCMLACLMVGCVDPVTVTMDTTELSLFVGSTKKLNTTLSRELLEDEQLIWTSDKEEVATVNKNGTVSAKADGTAIITVSIGESSATCTVTVKTRRTMTVSQEEATIDLDTEVKTVTLTATCSDGGSEIEWASDNESVATVVNGVVTGVDVGTAKITATRGEASASCTVTVVQPSRPYTYNLERGNANAVVATRPGEWFYFDKTSNGAQFDVAEATFSHTQESDTVSMTLNYATQETSNEGEISECYFRYQPEYAEGTVYTISFKLTCNYAGFIIFGSSNSVLDDPDLLKYEVEAGQTIEVVSQQTVSGTPLNIRNFFYGGDAENPLEVPIVITLSDIVFTVEQA